MFEKNLLVPADGWSAAALLHELQEASGDAVRAAHATGADLKPLGLMWVVVRYDLSLSRAFRPGENLHLTTWANPFRHRMSQRNYLIYSAEGEVLLRGAGVWAIADRTTRSMTDAESHGIVFDTEITGSEMPRPATPEKLPLTAEESHQVTEADLDMNGHMNNTRYFDLAERCIETEKEGLTLQRARVVFQNEAVPGETLRIRRGREGTHWYFEGEGNGKGCFQMSLNYI